MQVKNFNIASIPGRGNSNNPYVDLFYDALLKHNIQLIDEPELDKYWLIANMEIIDAIHLHWPETNWRDHISLTPNNIRVFFSQKVPAGWRIIKFIDRLNYNNWQNAFGNFISKAEGLYNFISFINLCKKSNIRIIWTMHNIESHEGNDLLDHLGYYHLSKTSDLVIFHSNHAKNLYLKSHKIYADTVVMPHGNYAGVYPPPRNKNIILKNLGLRPDLPIVSCVGMLRNYKGLDIATEAIHILNGQVQFLCAGSPYPGFDVVSLKKELSELPNTLLIPRHLSDQEFSDYVSISDIVLLPYTKITGSGALLAVLTLCRAVISSDLPYFREVLENHPEAGQLFSVGNSKALADTIQNFLLTPSSTRNESAKKLADQYNWREVTKPVVDLIKTWTT